MEEAAMKGIIQGGIALFIGTVFLAAGCRGFDDSPTSAESPFIQADTTITLASMPGSVELLQGRSVGVVDVNAAFRFVGVLDSNYANDGTGEKNYNILMDIYGASYKKRIELNTHHDRQQCNFGDGPDFTIEVTEIKGVGDRYKITFLLSSISSGSAPL
jgi:hypothetical protein